MNISSQTNEKEHKAVPVTPNSGLNEAIESESPHASLFFGQEHGGNKEGSDSDSITTPLDFRRDWSDQWNEEKCSESLQSPVSIVISILEKTIGIEDPNDEANNDNNEFYPLCSYEVDPTMKNVPLLCNLDDVFDEKTKGTEERSLEKATLAVQKEPPKRRRLNKLWFLPRHQVMKKEKPESFKTEN